MKNIIDDLLLADARSSVARKKKLAALRAEINAGEFDKLKKDFPQSRLHAKLLMLGDTEILYRMEKGEYGD